MEEKIKYERGQIWYIRFNESVGSEEAVGRPAVIVASNEGLATMRTVTVVYTTTTPRTNMGRTVELSTTKKRSWALCDQIATLDKSRFIDLMGNATESEMLKIDLALRKALALPIKVENNVENKSCSDDVDLKFEAEMYRRLYEKAIEKLTELKFEKDTAPVIAKEEPPVVEELDLAPLEKIATVRKPKKQKKSLQKVNINTATVEDFVEKLNIGAVTANEIVAYRKRNGLFKDVTDILKIRRVGTGTYGKIIHYLEV